MRALAGELQGRGRDPRRIVVCAQNHDQVGNRAHRRPLAAAALRVAAAVVLFSPCTPLLFMGEEYLEPQTVPVLHGSHRSGIAAATREGRRQEFAAFSAFSGRGDTRIRRPSRRSCARSSLSGEPDPLLPRAARASARAAGGARGRGRRGEEVSASAAAETSSSSPTSARADRGAACADGRLARQAVPARTDVGRARHELRDLLGARGAGRAVPVRRRTTARRGSR